MRQCSSNLNNILKTCLSIDLIKNIHICKRNIIFIFYPFDHFMLLGMVYPRSRLDSTVYA